MRRVYSVSTCWSILTLLIACVILACAVTALDASKGFKDSTMCILTNMVDLANSNITGGNMTDVPVNLNPMVLNVASAVIDWWMYAMIAPGAAYFVILVFAVIFSCMALYSKCCPSVTSKAFIFLGWFVAGVTLAFFCVCAALGIFTQIPITEAFWIENVVLPCSTSVADSTNQFNSANASAQDCVRQYGQSNCAGSTQQLNNAAEQLTKFTLMCSCASAWLVKSEPLAAPGVVGALATLLAFFLSLGTCCTLACCFSFTAAMEKNAPKKEKDKNFTGAKDMELCEALRLSEVHTHTWRG